MWRLLNDETLLSKNMNVRTNISQITLKKEIINKHAFFQLVYTKYFPFAKSIFTKFSKNYTKFSKEFSKMDYK